MRQQPGFRDSLVQAIRSAIVEKKYPDAYEHAGVRPAEVDEFERELFQFTEPDKLIEYAQDNGVELPSMDEMERQALEVYTELGGEEGVIN